MPHQICAIHGLVGETFNTKLKYTGNADLAVRRISRATAFVMQPELPACRSWFIRVKVVNKAGDIMDLA